jgi:uncharacterized protein YkwD
VDIKLQGSGEAADQMRVKTALILCCVALSALTFNVGAASAKSHACKDAKLVPTRPEQMRRLSVAVRCLVNRERRRHKLPNLKQNRPLNLASRWQAHDMLDHAYFDHRRDGGPEFAERVLRFGYAANASGYSIGENIAWASSPIATPQSIVKMWMNSPSHRENILTRAFRDQGVSAVWSYGNGGGAYANSGGPFVIFVNQFGRQYGPMRKR